MVQTRTSRESESVAVPWYRRAGIWIGIGINPASITLGGGLAAHLPLSALLFWVPLGAVVLMGLTIAQGVVSRRRREPLAKRAVSTFGSGVGAGLLNLLIALSIIGWGGFHAGIAGFSLANIFNLPVWLGALGVVSILFILSDLGINHWNWLVWLTTLAALGLAFVSLVAVGARPSLDMTAVGLGFYDWLWVTGSMVAYAIVFSLRCGDFTWDLRTDSDVVKNGLSLFIPLVISLLIGAILFQAAGDWNIADILARTRLAILGHLFLLVAIASPALSGIHSGALAISNITGLSKRSAVGLICTVNFVLGSTRFDYQLLPFLSYIGTVLPTALVVMLTSAVLTKKPSRIATLTAWFVGSVAALIFKFEGGDLIHIAVGAIVSLVVLQVMMHFASIFEYLKGVVTSVNTPPKE